MELTQQNTSPDLVDVKSPADASAPSACEASSLSTPRPQPRSCIFCRQRKIKCDRQNPCSNCARGRLECAYPAGRGRAAKRPRQVLDGPLLDRLHRLESIIKHLTSQSGVASSVSKPNSQPGPVAAGQSNAAGEQHQTSSKASGSASPEASIDQYLGRLMIDENQSYYVSNILWANLGSEIEELRDMLQEPASEDEICAPMDINESEVSSPLGSSASILGFRAISHSLLTYHPPLPQSVALYNVFVENVLPLVHILHAPTMSRMYWDSIASLDSLDRNTEVLLFSIYYSAVISMDANQCFSVLGETRVTSIEKYRFAMEQALAPADFLNTQSIVLLQAAVLFVSALRNEDDSRTAWALTSLIYHIARSMGLHRDGTVFGLKPFDIELRRRLWYYICFLDIRSSEFHGYEPIAHEGSFDTKPPLNVNDSDLSPPMAEPPRERIGPTEMTFCLIRCEAIKVNWEIGYTPSLGAPGQPQEKTVEDRKAIVEGLKQRLEERFLQHCDASVPFLLLSSTVAQLIIARMWLVVHYPTRHTNGLRNVDAATRNQLFSTSVKILELSSLLLTHNEILNWTWHSKTHIQWHAVMFVLSEICSRPPSAEFDRAWELVNIVHDGWDMKNNGKKGKLWKPIKRLMAKARYVRDMQKIGPATFGRSTTLGASIPNGVQVSFSSNILSNAPTTSAEGSGLDHIDIVPPGIEPLGGYPNISLEDLEAEIFNTMSDGDSWQWNEYLN